MQILVNGVFDQVFILDRILEFAANRAEEYEQYLELCIWTQGRVDIKGCEEFDKVLEAHASIHAEMLKVRLNCYMNDGQTVNYIWLVNYFNALSDLALQILANRFLVRIKDISDKQLTRWNFVKKRIAFLGN